MEEKGTSYFVMKTLNVDSLGQSIREGIWATPLHKFPPQPHERLNIAYEKSKEVILVFSVNNSKSWKGYAKMLQSVPPPEKQFTGEANKVDIKDRLSEVFKVEWLKKFPNLQNHSVPYAQTAHIVNSLEDNQPVNLSRNCQEISAEAGDELCKLIDAAVAAEERKIADEIRAREQRIAESQFFVSSATDSEETWDAFLAEVSKVGEVLYAGHIGSRSLNLHHEKSDADMLTIVASPSMQILSLTPPQKTVKNADSFEPDYTLHEVGFFCELLVGGDSRILETLFHDRTKESNVVVHESDEFKFLREHRSLFLTKKVLEKYLSEVHGYKGISNLEKMYAKLEEKLKENNPADAASNEEQRVLISKKWYIVFRLLMNAQQIVNGQDIKLWLPNDSEERNFLLSIRKGVYSHQELLGKAKDLNAEIEKKANSPECPLPEKENDSTIALLEKWLYELRLKGLPAPTPSTPVNEISELQKRAEAFCKEKNIPGKVLFLTQRRPEHSWMGVYSYSPKKAFSSFTLPLDATISGTQSEEIIVHEEGGVDRTETRTTEFNIYEVNKYCEMIMGGNPNCVELLFIDEVGKNQEREREEEGGNEKEKVGEPVFVYESEEWLELKRQRDAVLSQRAFDRIVGYVKGFLKRQTAKKKPTKKKQRKGKKEEKEKEEEEKETEEEKEDWPPSVLRVCEFLETFRNLFMVKKEKEGEVPQLPHAQGKRREQVERLVEELERQYQLKETPPAESEVLQKLNEWVMHIKTKHLEEERRRSEE